MCNYFRFLYLTDEEQPESLEADGGEEEDGKKRKRKRRKGTGNSADAADVSADKVTAPVKDTRPMSSASKPKPTVEERQEAGVEKSKDKKSKKSKKPRKKEESEMDKRLGLYR
jgi:hypothetical protein